MKKIHEVCQEGKISYNNKTSEKSKAPGKYKVTAKMVKTSG